ncbi:MAG: hypothetical protein IJF67_04560, partial [Clostridia bacterium]|nr:hypothetical protein [Clostridia bacterium]
MKKRMHSIICLLLAVLLTASCGSTGTPADTTASGGEDTTTAAPEYDRIAELGAHDFGGDTFTILDQADIKSNCPVDERDGDVLNDT